MHRFPSRLGAAIVIGAALGALLAGLPVRAQIIPCSGVDEPGFKVLLDDITPIGGTASPLMLPLIHRIDANLEQLEVETGLVLKVLRCANRKPASPADFKRALVQDLTARQVVLEVWGTTTEVSQGTEQFHEASIGYALIPVRLHEFDAQNPPGAFTVARRTKSVSSVDELLRLVDQGGTLAAYAAVGAGTKLLRSQEYDQARTQLCKASALLEIIDAAPGSPDTALLAYAKRRAAEAVTSARADPQYAGPLKVLPSSAVAECRGPE